MQITRLPSLSSDRSATAIAPPGPVVATFPVAVNPVPTTRERVSTAIPPPPPLPVALLSVTTDHGVMTAVAPSEAASAPPEAALLRSNSELAMESVVPG